MGFTLLDWFGYFASLVVLISLLTSSIIKLRWINLFGAAMFSTYGMLIHSLPTAAMNAGIVVIDIYYLIKIYSSKEYFQMLELSTHSNYFTNFIKFYHDEIEQFFGAKSFEIHENTIGFYVLRNMVPASLFVGQPVDEHTLMVQLDFATPAYRDFKIGKYIYEKHSEFFINHGFTTLQAKANSKQHESYLIKMGFNKKDEFYVKNLK
ncbi:MAG: hypothetical protein JXR88_14180 [Clostridia bacterium]|nr:hypothetical protein [Clostridia bacterium]